MMKRVFALTIVFFVILIQISCNSSSGQTTEQIKIEPSKSPNENVAPKKPISTNVRESKYDDDSKGDYAKVFTIICYNRDFRSVSGTSAGFKRETIKPENVEILKSNSEIETATLESFIERNLTTKNLINGYDVKFDIVPIDKKDSDENLVVFAHKKKQRIKSIIGVSRIGFNEDRTQSLTYFEFYGSDRKLQKNYILLSWDYSRGGASVKDAKWISAE